MKYLRSIVLLLSILMLSCNQQVPTPEEFANTIVEMYGKNSSISYDIDYQIKYFSDTKDTNKVSAKIGLIRSKEDSIFGGIVWIETDSIVRYYDGNFTYYINHQSKTITRFPKGKPYSISGNSISEAIRIYFLKPDRLINGINDSTIEKRLIQDAVEPDQLLQWTYTFPDDGDYTKTSKQIWFNQDDLSVQKMTYNTTYQNENQYNQWDIKNVRYNELTEETLKERFERLLDSYLVEDYKEMTEGERAPLSNGTAFPELKGVLYPSNDSSSIKKLQGKVTLVDFWYMDCPPCIDAIPHLNDLNKKYADQGLRVIGADPIDNTEKNLGRLPNFLENNEISYPILFTSRADRKKHKIMAYPTLYMLNETGEVIFSHVGFGEELPSAVDSLIKVELKIP